MGRVYDRKTWRFLFPREVGKKICNKAPRCTLDSEQAGFTREELISDTKTMEKMCAHLTDNHIHMSVPKRAATFCPRRR